MAKFVAYYRVSTAQQGKSGLGLEAQKLAVEDYIDKVGGQLMASFREVESGKNDERPELAKALNFCERAKAMLVVARLDRLARNVHFITRMMESPIEFLAVDMPEANRLTMHIIAAVAEYEREAASARTKKALSAAKAAGTKLGNPRIADARPLAVIKKIEKADNFASTIERYLKLYDPQSKLSATKLANIFNVEGVKTRRGGFWTAATVIGIRRRLLNLTGKNDATTSS